MSIRSRNFLLVALLIVSAWPAGARAQAPEAGTEERLREVEDRVDALDRLEIHGFIQPQLKLEDTASEPEVVFCALDPSPHAFEYEYRGDELHWVSDFHDRPRLPHHDIDVCMGGRIAVTEIPVQPPFDPQP